MNYNHSSQLVKKLIDLDEQVQKKSPSLPKFSLNGSGCRNKAENMPAAASRIATYVGILSEKLSESFVLMITASHNPADQNGIKIGSVGDSTVPDEILKEIQDGLNDSKLFRDFINENLAMEKLGLLKKKAHKQIVYIGMDCRPSSPIILQTIVKIMKLLEVQLILVGRCTTPELFSLSKNIWETFQKKGKIKQLQLPNYYKNYVQQVLQNFDQCLTQIKKLDENFERPKILLDFANGSGAVSFAHYHEKLQKHFDLSAVNDSDFQNPNDGCGAQYMYSNWPHQVEKQKYSLFDYCFFFDGDSDRVIGKIQNSKDVIDGNVFLLYYYKAIRKILSHLSQDILEEIEEMLGKQLSIKVVGNTNTNLGVNQAFKNKGLKMQIANIGIQNLYNKAKINAIISIFFQPNGHGGIYFGKEFIEVLEKIKKAHPHNLQLKILININAILKNNARGYALHNFLVFFIFTNYIRVFSSRKQANNFSEKLFYPKFFQSKRDFRILDDFKNIFRNSQTGKYLLEHPTQIIEEIKNIQSQLKNEFKKQGKQIHLEVQMRKSATEDNLVRLHIQSPVHAICQSVASKIEIKMKKYTTEIVSMQKSHVSQRLSTYGDQSDGL